MGSSHGRGRPVPARAGRRAGGDDAAPLPAGSGWAIRQLVQGFVQGGRIGRAEAALHARFPADDSRLALGLGCVYAHSGRQAEARPWLRRAARDPALREAAEVELAEIASRTRPGRWPRRLLEAARRLERRQDHWGHAAVLVRQAVLLLQARDLDGSLALAQRAAALRERLGDRLGVGFALQVQAKALYQLGDYTGAIERLRRALGVHEPENHRLEAAVVHNNIGLWHLDLANAERAAGAFRASRRLFRQLGDRWREGAVLANLGNALRQLGRRAAAERSYESALGLLRKGPSPDAYVIALAEWAEAHTRARRPRRALLVLAGEERALSLRASPRARLLLDLERARACLEAGRVREALAAASCAAAVLREAGGPERGRYLAGARIETVRGLALLAAGRTAEACLSLRKVEVRLERLLDSQHGPAARIGLVSTYREAQDALVSCLLETGRAAAAWRTAARFKARELRLGRPDLSRSGRETRTARELSRLRMATALSDADRRRLPQLHQRHADELEERRERRTRRPRSSAGPLPWRIGDAALVEYHVGRSRSDAFVVHGGRLVAVALPIAEAELQAAVERLLRPLAQAARSDDPRADLETFDLALAHRLHRLLLAPALAAIPGSVRRLVLVPDGPLHGLPFELLVASLGADRSGHARIGRRDGATYAVERHAISYAQSALLLAPAPARDAASASLLALGYAPGRDAQLHRPEGDVVLAPLPGVAAEIRAIARHFPDRTVRLGADATAGAYASSAPTSGVIHLAAHAVADARAPLLSGVVLAPERPGEKAGFLTAERIRRLPLKADLVTLSACDSGRGQLRAREGVLGIARAFLEAGAGAVLASLWPVDDEATRELMARFYAGVAAGEDPTRALAGAKRALRAASPQGAGALLAHPYYWGGFVLLDHRPRL